MTLRVAFRRAAKDELLDAAAWYEDRRPGLGDEFAFEIEQIVAAIAATPTRWPVVMGDVRRAVARRFPYAVYFRVRADAVVVLAVFHGRRDPAIWRRRS